MILRKQQKYCLFQMINFRKFLPEGGGGGALRQGERVVRHFLGPIFDVVVRPLYVKVIKFFGPL